MSAKAVLVCFNLEGSRHSGGASGILFNENLVITTGTILIPFIRYPEGRKWVTSLLNESSSKLETSAHVNKISFRVYEELNHSNGTGKNKIAESLPVRCRVVGVWKCPLVTNSLENLFYDWTLGQVTDNHDSNVESSRDIDMSMELMSVFILLRCEGRGEQDQNKERDKSNDHIRGIFNLLFSLVEPNRGQEVELISTPFGDRFFINSLSRGIISNVVGNKKCFILTDARTVSGCEGGPIFTTKQSRQEQERGKLIGLITCPLTSWRGEWVGLTIGISLMPVLKRLLQSEEDAFNCTESSINKSANDSSFLELVDETVVLIRCGASWGSGVILNAASGIIITCSHVVSKDRNISVFYKRNHYPATVVFSCQDDVTYDLAIIKIKGNSVFHKEIEFSDSPAKIGEAVIAVGFPFFSERDDFNIRPSLVCGCVARVNPFMIQTTCCIQSGFSGGALLRNGKLLGIIICNARDSAVGALFPHINFAVPTSIFQAIVSDYIKTNNVRYLKGLQTSDPKVQSLWSIQTSKL